MLYSDLLDIMNIIKGMLDNEPDKEDFKKMFMFKEQEYGFVPNLSAISTDFKKHRRIYRLRSIYKRTC